MHLDKEPQIVCEFRNSRAGLQAFLVIDSIGPSGACGGIRITEDITLEEVMTLARAMTLKYSFLKVIPLGGAKAGIVLPPDCDPEKRSRVLDAFGCQLAPLLQKGIYHPWTDMNTVPEDLNRILAAAGLPRRSWADSGYYTALSVVAAIKAACEVKRIEVRGLTVAIEGFGAVGSRLAEELYKLGARVIAVSTQEGALNNPDGLDVPELLSLRKRHGSALVRNGSDRQIAREELLELEADILVPGARPWSVHAGNAGKLRARIIVPAANDPITDEAKEILTRRGIDSIPYFVSNSGGALGSYLNSHSVEEAKIRKVVLEDFKLNVKELIERSLGANRPLEETALDSGPAPGPSLLSSLARAPLFSAAAQVAARLPIFPHRLRASHALGRVRRRLHVNRLA